MVGFEPAVGRHADLKINAEKRHDAIITEMGKRIAQ